jgi:S-adenosylmethionine:tRNA ribosyltransferase-isomerase
MAVASASSFPDSRHELRLSGLSGCCGAVVRVASGEAFEEISASLCLLEPLEPGVDTAPARADEVDEQGQVVDAGVPLGEKLALESFEPPDRLVQQAPDLGDVTTDRQHLGPKTVADCRPDLGGDGRLELGSGDGQRLQLLACPLQRPFEIGLCGAARGGVGNAPLCALECQCVHGRRGYSQHRMDVSLLDYHLPPDLVAQRPVEPRDAARLLLYRKATGAIEHHIVADLPDLLSDELTVVNDTRVVPARLHLRRESGGAVEVLLLEAVDGNGTWEALARPSKRLRTGEELGPVRLLDPLGDGRWLVRLEGEPHGEAPLPPYIREPLVDPDRYQTVYARDPGSAAAPTAGLHFTPELVERIDPARVTLHVGLDTFRPVTASTLEEHVLHGERYEVAPGAWARISGAPRVLAAGTTTVRVLETVARTGELEGRTTLFITPGFSFRRVDALLTNFHLPRSTLVALVMAFVGVEELLRIYDVAVAERYHFYSFGDAMLVL